MYSSMKYNLSHPVSKNVGWVVLEKIASLIIGLATLALVARHLGLSNFGLYSFSIAFPQMMQIISTLGLGQLVIRDFSQDKLSQSMIIGSMVFLFFVTGLASAVATVVLAFLLQSRNPENIVLISIASLSMIFTPSTVISNWFQSQLKAKYISIVGIVTLVIVSLIRLILVYYNSGVIWFVCTNVISAGIGAIGLIIAYWKIKNKFHLWSIDISYIKSILTEGWPKLGHAVVTTLGRKSDMVLLGVLATPEAVGIYAIAYRIQMYLAFFPSVVANSLAPGLSKSKITTESDYQESLLNSYKIIFIIFIISGLPIIFLSPGIISFLYGSEFQNADSVLSILSAGLLFIGIGNVRSWFITNERIFKYGLIVGISVSFISIMGNLLIIPIYGAIGAALVSLLSYILGNIIFDWLYRPARKNAFILLSAIKTLPKNIFHFSKG